MIAKRINKVVREGDLTKIENYDKAVADKTQTWVCHHRLELTLDGEFAHTPEELKRMGMYYNRPYFELIFLTRSEHHKLHGNSMCEKTKKKISESNKGKTIREEQRKKLSEFHKGLKPNENTRKKLRRPESDFGWKYFEHYGHSKHENPKQYQKERQWYHQHYHKCSWE